MNLDIENVGPHTVFKIKGELNLYNVSTIRKGIYEYLDQNEDVESIVIDLKDSSYLDSSGIALLSLLQRRVKGDDGKFYLINVNTKIFNALKLASLDKHFTIYDSLEDIED